MDVFAAHTHTGCGKGASQSAWRSGTCHRVPEPRNAKKQQVCLFFLFNGFSLSESAAVLGSFYRTTAIERLTTGAWRRRRGIFRWTTPPWTENICPAPCFPFPDSWNKLLRLFPPRISRYAPPTPKRKQLRRGRSYATEQRHRRRDKAREPGCQRRSISSRYVRGIRNIQNLASSPRTVLRRWAGFL